MDCNGPNAANDHFAESYPLHLNLDCNGTTTPYIKAVQAVQAVHEEMNGRAYLYFRTGRLFVCRARTRARNGSPGLQNGTDKPFRSGDQNGNGGTVPVPFRARSPFFAQPVANSDPT